MADHWFFFLDAEGRVVGPESAPSSGDERILRAACTALRAEAIRSNLRPRLPEPHSERETPIASVSRLRLA